MPAAIPTQEPQQIVAGMTVRWRRALDDYPASAGWSLKYAIRGATAPAINLIATADGDEFAVTIPAATTDDYPAGRYQVVGYVEGVASERHEVYRGLLVVVLDPVAATQIDPRSHARRVLEAIEAVLEKRATRDQQSYAIQGRSLARWPVADLLLLRDRYRADVAREEARDAIDQGRRPRRTIRARFGCP